MPNDTPTQSELLLEIEGLKARLGEAEETLRAIHNGETDAIVVSGPEGNRVFTLQSADQSYRILIETMNEGTVTLLPGGTVAYSNRGFAEMVRTPLEKIIGSSFVRFLSPPEASLFSSLLEGTGSDGSKAEHTLIASDGTRVPAQVSARPLRDEAYPGFCVVVTDLTHEKEVERARNELLVQKSAEEAVQQSEERLRSVVETSYDWVWEVNARGVYTYTSPRVRDLLGYQPEDVLGRTPFDFMPPDEAKRIKEEFSALARDGRAFRNLETVRRHKDGRQVIFETSGLPIFDAHNNLTGFRGITRDITERKRAEQKLHHSEERLRSLIETSRDWVWEVDANGVYTYSSPKVVDILGYRLEEIVGKTPFDFMAPDEAKRVGAKFAAFATERKSFRNLENVNLHKEGRQVILETNGMPIFDAEGGLTGYRGIDRDITDRKRAEEARVLLASIVESSDDAIVAHTPEGKIASWNHGAEVLFGYPAEEAIGKHVSMLIASERAEDWSQVASRLEQGEGVPSFEGRGVRKDGRKVAVSITISPILDAAGHFAGSSAIIRDVTERKRAEAEMIERTRLATLAAEIGIALTEAETLRGGLQRCCEAVVRNIDAAFARIWTLNESERMLELQASAGMYTHIDGGHARVPIGKFKIGRIAENGEPHLTNSVLEDSWVGDPEWARREGMVAFAGYPLMIGSRVVGIVGAFARHPLSEPVIQGLGSVANVIAQFITRQRAEEEVYQSRYMLQTILDTIPQRVFWKDRNINYLGCNRAFAIDAGVQDPAGIVGKNDFELSWKETAELHRADDRQVINLESPKLNFEEPLARPDGSRLWLRTNKVPLRDRAGRVIGVIGTYEDITEQRDAEKALRDSEEQFRQLAENIREVFFVVTADPLRITYISPAYEQIWGRPRQELYDRTEAWVEATHPEDRDQATSVYARAQQGEATDIEFRIVRPDGFMRWIRVRTFPVSDMQGKFYRFVGTAEDITERKLAEERIQFLAYYDGLTGLPNRTLLNDRLERALAGARRRRDKLALLFLDLDRFKVINDSLGHSVGDLLLQEVAERLRKWARAQDTVARLGGDEFLIALTTIKDAPDAAVAAERIMEAMTQEFVIRGHSFTVTCSIGISIYPDHGADAETLIKNADAAMYSAKEGSRDAFRFFTDDLNGQALERLTFEHSLRVALSRNELFLLYQPQVELGTGKISGFEALLRWRHPDLRLVAPDKFIRIAENSGLIIPIGEWVVRTACATARKWQGQGLPAVPIAVNVSAVQFSQPGFLELIRQVLRETTLSPKYLELELTENLLMSNADETLRVLRELRAMGVALAIDDFGTGYSSLSYLRQFRVSKLKIDRSFVQHVALNPDDAAITAAIISLAKSLNLKVIAEGVENEAQMSFLRDHQCDEIQGYYFSKPLMAEEAAEKLRQRSQAFAARNKV